MNPQTSMIWLVDVCRLPKKQTSNSSHTKTKPEKIPYSEKFSNGANFHIFRMLAPYLKIKLQKLEQHRQLLRVQFEVLTMSLYSYFVEASK